MVARSFDIEQSSNVVTATIRSRQLGSAEAQVLAEELVQRMRYDGAMFFVLDMSQVEFVDSSCLGTMVMFLQDLGTHPRAHRLGHCNRNVAFLFKATRLDSVFTLYDDLEEARAQIAHG
jgi:Anti-anti-sigma regulatory factor (antagonist of anti-sigma factor)